MRRSFKLQMHGGDATHDFKSTFEAEAMLLDNIALRIDMSMNWTRGSTSIRHSQHEFSCYMGTVATGKTRVVLPRRSNVLTWTEFTVSMWCGEVVRKYQSAVGSDSPPRHPVGNRLPRPVEETWPVTASPTDPINRGG